jgi:signal transduction histidine kinase
LDPCRRGQPGPAGLPQELRTSEGDLAIVAVDDRPDVAELRALFLFEELSDEQLHWLCRFGSIHLAEPGWVYREGEPAAQFYVLLNGLIVLTSRVGEDDVEFIRTDRCGVFGGAFQAYLGDRLPRYTTSMRAETTARFFVLSAEDFGGLMRDWFPMAVHLLEGLFFGNHGTQLAIGQRERLLALGSLAAGLSHELNNPAAAIGRAASSLGDRVAGLRRSIESMATGEFDRNDLADIVRLQQRSVSPSAIRTALTPLEAAEREDQVAEWLDVRDVADGWELAPTFVQAGLDTTFLDEAAALVPAPALGDVLRWLSNSIETDLLTGEIQEAAARISALVDATKQYAQLDRAPYQVVDVHDLLDSTLVVRGKSLGGGVIVVRDYDRTLDKVPAFAAELNQVWSNLIDNALSAMGGAGTLSLRTSRDDDLLLVEVEDTGPGVPDEIRSRIFEPFFTTKAVGEGTGLGLDLAWRIVTSRHHGDLRVDSVPGRTTFQVRLPFEEHRNVSVDGLPPRP